MLATSPFPPDLMVEENESFQMIKFVKRLLKDGCSDLSIRYRKNRVLVFVISIPPQVQIRFSFFTAGDSYNAFHNNNGYFVQSAELVLISGGSRAGVWGLSPYFADGGKSGRARKPKSDTHLKQNKLVNNDTVFCERRADDLRRRICRNDTRCTATLDHCLRCHSFSDVVSAKLILWCEECNVDINSPREDGIEILFKH